jgi:ribosomal-protein-alanine N-acetyltransferase
MGIIYENNIIRLREARLDDSGELLSITNDEEVMKYYGMGPYINLEEAEEEINWFLGLNAEGKGARWIIADKSSDKYVGDIGVFNFDETHNKVEIGFKLKKECWNKGIMSDCIKKTLEFAFMELKYNRVEALVDKRNIGCKKALEKSGFKLEGLLREYEFEHGQYVDLEMYSILYREFNKLSMN